MTQTAARTNHTRPRSPEMVEVSGSMITSTAAKALAVLRISTGFVFLWAFLDKTFGLNYATPSAKAWINGGSPTKGFLASVEVGPLQSFFHAIAGTWWANGLFMLGLLVEPGATGPSGCGGRRGAGPRCGPGPRWCRRRWRPTRSARPRR